MNIRNALMLLFGVLFAVAANAQPVPSPMSNPRVVPNPVMAGQPIFLRLASNGCVGWMNGDETVTVVDHVVTFTHRLDEICGVPPPGFDWDFPIGTLPPGLYTLVYAPTSGFALEYEVQSVQFTVGALRVPAATDVALALLALAVFGAGVQAARRRARSLR